MAIDREHQDKRRKAILQLLAERPMSRQIEIGRVLRKMGYKVTRSMTGTRMSRREGCILRRMPRMQVYLPDDLYEQVKARSLPASELLQKAVRAELARQEILSATDRYVEDLVAEVGPPTAEQRASAAAVARRIARRPTRRVG
jgi:post-segregation antitoxin (ccd killing protein)